MTLTLANQILDRCMIVINGEINPWKRLEEMHPLELKALALWMEGKPLKAYQYPEGCWAGDNERWLEALAKSLEIQLES